MEASYGFSTGWGAFLNTRMGGLWALYGFIITLGALYSFITAVRALCGFITRMEFTYEFFTAIEGPHMFSDQGPKISLGAALNSAKNFENLNLIRWN